MPMSEYRYLNIKQIAESVQYPFTLGQMRHYLIMRHKNGLHTAVRKIGKRLFLRVDLFEEWIECQGEHDVFSRSRRRTS
jgi:hypothetical protein